VEFWLEEPGFHQVQAAFAVADDADFRGILSIDSPGSPKLSRSECPGELLFGNIPDAVKPVGAAGEASPYFRQFM
jgi:hypothetical protein